MFTVNSKSQNQLPIHSKYKLAEIQNNSISSYVSELPKGLKASSLGIIPKQISFTSNSGKLQIPPDLVEKIASEVEGGAAGYRAPFTEIIPRTGEAISGPDPKNGKEFNYETTRLITDALSAYCVSKLGDPNNKTGADYNKIIIGGDTRLSSMMCLPRVVDQLVDNGFEVICPESPIEIGERNFAKTGDPICKDKPLIEVPVPAIALAAKQLKTGTGYYYSASHNPWPDGGLKFITSQGCLASSDVTGPIGQFIKQIGNRQIDVKTRTGNKGKISTYNPYEMYKRYIDENIEFNWKSISEFIKQIGNRQIDVKTRTGNKGKISTYNPYEMYKKHIDENIKINWKAINDADIFIGYDGLKGSGSPYFIRLLEEHGIKVPLKMDSDEKSPLPDPKFLTKLSAELAKEPTKNKIGLSNDADCDRYGIIDENGKFMDTEDTLLIVLHHLLKNRKVKLTDDQGRPSVILCNQATTPKLARLARKYGLEVMPTPIGFKFIAQKIFELEQQGRNVIMCGEESGGMTIGGHIPEKDGFLTLLLVLEMMGEEKKPVGEILNNVYKELDIHCAKTRNNLTFPTDKAKKDFIAEFEKYRAGDQGHLQLAGYNINSAMTQKFFDIMKQYQERPDGDGVKLYFDDGKEFGGEKFDYCDCSSFLTRMSDTENIARIYIDTYGKTDEEAKAKGAKIESEVLEIAKKPEFGGQLKDH